MAGRTAGGASRTVAENRRARHDYHLDKDLEAGLVLTGTEVKALRQGRANIAESYIAAQDDHLELVNANIPIYEAANRQNHEPKRPRKLLLHRREMDALLGAIRRQGRTVVPLRLYFNDRGLVKLRIAIATGKKLHDKRATAKERDWKRDQARLMRERG